jgi:hypothetical protein
MSAEYGRVEENEGIARTVLLYSEEPAVMTIRCYRAAIPKAAKLTATRNSQVLALHRLC